MTIELLVQFLVLGATAFLFWRARRDLAAASRAAPPADTQELEQLCETLEALVTDLAGRLERVEQLVASEESPRPKEESPRPKRGVRGQAPAEKVPAALQPEDSRLSLTPEGFSPSRPALPVPVPMHPAPETDDPPDAHYAPVYALLETGLTDPQEIARRTGLSRGEVDLILSLRAHRAI